MIALRSGVPDLVLRACSIVIALSSLVGPGCSGQVGQKTQTVPEDLQQTRDLSHEETLQWIAEHQAWRHARKVKPIWARPVEADEIGKEFQTADRAIEVAKQGHWLCVGVAEEPWFQKEERITAKYVRTGEEMKQFAFDTQSHAYQIYTPKDEIWNWAAQVKGYEIKGFYIRPNYDPDRPLYSPAGGFVVKDDVPDPYEDKPADVWLVQESLFNSTYELEQ